MRAFHALPFVVLMLLASARAEDATSSVDLAAAPRWKVGETLTCTAKDHVTAALTVRTVKPQDKRESSHETRLDAAWRARCEEADAAGRPVRVLVHLDSWVAESDGVVDRCIEDAFVEVGARGWTLLRGDDNPTHAASAWLDRHLGTPARAALVGPVEAVAGRTATAGETWEWDGREAARAALGAWTGPLLPETLALTCRLDAAEPSPDGATVHVSGSGEGVPRDGRPGVPAPAKGSVVKTRIDLTGAIADARRDLRGEVGVDLVLRFTTSNVWAETRVTAECVEERKAGGTFPEPPARDPAAARDVAVSGRSVWAVGDEFTEKGSDSKVLRAVPIDADGKESDPVRSEESVEWSAVVRCTEVDPDGRPTAFRVRFESWKSTVGGAEDTALTGAEFDVGPRGWRTVDGAAAPKGRAKAWLDREWSTASAEDASRAAVRPAMRAAPGQSWNVGADDIVESVREWTRLPVDTSDAASLATMEAVRGDDGAETATVSWCVDAPVRCVAGCSCTNAEVLRGGRVRVTGTAEGPASAWDRAGKTSETVELTITVPGKGEDVRRLTFSRERSRERAPVVHLQD